MRVRVKTYCLWMILLLSLPALRAEDRALNDSTKIVNYSAATDSTKIVNDTAKIVNDTAKIVNDSTKILNDSTRFANDTKPQPKSKINGPVHYQASDSMVMMGNGTAYLHGKGELKYQTMELESEYIRMNIDSSQIYACGVWDSIEEEWRGKPVFKEGKDEYETNEITYNIFRIN